MVEHTSEREKERTERFKKERMAYVGLLAAGLVHEARTPLHAIQLNVEMLSEDTELLPSAVRDKFARRCKRVYDEVKSLTKVLDAFLTFARPPRLAPEPADMNQFLREFIEYERAEMDEAGVAITQHLSKDMYPVSLDTHQFTHVLLNLFRNAKESIEQRRERESYDFEGDILISSEEDEKEISFTVADNGIGLAEGDEEKIFEVFYTTKPKGTGLGLGIVRRIVEDHNGRIVALGGRDGGALFRVTLPRVLFLGYGEETGDE
jgi:signal transduction histidine kinase